MAILAKSQITITDLWDGIDGAPGTSSYFHVKYSPVANPTDAQIHDEVDTYIGTYVDNEITDSPSASKYKWIKIEGIDGEQGVPGKDGVSGQTSYLHVKYSDNVVYTNNVPSGDFTANNGETPGAFIGQYVDFIEDDSKVFADYRWYRIKGEQGPVGPGGVGYTINITGGTRGIAYAADGTGPSPETSAEFTAQLLKNGEAQTTIDSCSWSVGGAFASGTVGNTPLKYTPRIIEPIDTKKVPSTFVTVSIKPSANEEAVVQTVPIVVTANADGLDWLADWNTGKTTIKEKSIASPRIFAGINTGVENAPNLTGVALGKDVLGGSETQIGLVGYQENTPTFKLGTDGTFLVAKAKNSVAGAGAVVNGELAGIYFDGANLSITGNVAIKGGTIGDSTIGDIIDGANNGTDAKNDLENKVDATQIDVFNALTNNGQTQGIFIKEQKVYINGEYIDANTIRSDMIHASGISADKIKTGILQAQSGGSYLNLNDGKMLLGNTGGANYLQWDGTNLTIKAKNLSIGSESVATDSSVDSAIDSLEKRKRNLILNSKLEVQNNNYLTAVVNTSVDLTAGKKYTIVLNGVTTGGQKIGVWMNGGASNVSYLPINQNGTAYATFTAITPSSNENKRNLSFYNYPSSGASANPAKINWVALYEGDFASPELEWSPAPEDSKAVIKNVDVEYAINQSATSAPTSGWQTNPPEWKDGWFIWSRTKTTLVGGVQPSITEPVCITGAKGTTGNNFLSFTTDYSYQQSQIDNYANNYTGTWNVNEATNTAKVGDTVYLRVYNSTKKCHSFIVAKINTVYTSSLNTTSIGVSESGSVGEGVKNIIELYKKLTTKEQQPTPTSDTGWSTTPPEWSTGSYIHTCSKITYTGSTPPTYTVPVCDSSWDAINDIKVGGRNLMLLSTPELLRGASVTDKWLFDRGSFKVDVPSSSTGFNGEPVYWLTCDRKESNAWACLKIEKDRLFTVEKDEEYTLSFRSYIGVNSNGIFFKLFVKGDSSSQLLHSFDGTGTQHHKSITFKSNLDGEVYLCIYNRGLKDVESQTDSNVLFREIKLEKGNKATNWTPAPEDVSQEIITTVNEAKAEIKVETDKIALSVNAVDDRVTTIDGNVVSIDKRLKTAEQQITADAIIGTVKNAKETNGKATFAQTSVVEQLADRVTMSFKTNSDNMIRNSTGKGGIAFWHGDVIAGTRTSTGDAIGTHRFQCANNTTKEKLFQTNVFRVKSSTKYTVSFFIYTETKVDGADLYYMGRETITTDETSTGYASSNKLMSGVTTNNSWKQHTYTFITGPKDCQGYLRFDNNGTKESGTTASIFIAKVYLYEGDQPANKADGTVVHPDWCAHPSEVYEGITKIDQDGVTVTSSGVKSKTSMSATGFKITKTDTNEDVFKVNADGTLALKGSMTITGGLVPSNILSGTISESNLSSTIVNGAKNGTTAQGTLNSNSSNWTNAYNRVVQWASGAVSGSTTINGGLIATNTITAEKIAVGDFNNYCTAPTNYTMSAGAPAYQMTNNSFQNTNVTNKLTHLKGGEKFHASGKIYGGSGNSASAVFNTSFNWRDKDGNSLAASPSISVSVTAGQTVELSGEITVPTRPTNATYGTIKVWISDTAQTVFWYNPNLRLKATGEMIVDGSVTADKMNVKGLVVSDGTRNTLSVSSSGAVDINANSVKINVNGTYKDVGEVSLKVEQMTNGTRCHNLGAKINYSSFNFRDNGEIYLHGYDALGNPVDENGKISFNGTTYTVSKGMINPGLSCGGAGKDVIIFIHKNNASTVMAGWYDSNDKGYRYKTLLQQDGTASSFNPSNDHIAIGQFCMTDSENFAYAYLYEAPAPLKNVIDTGIDALIRINSAEQKITPDAIVGTVKNAKETNGKVTFAQTSVVEQLADKVSMSFKASGDNLIRNSTGKAGTAYWAGDGYAGTRTSTGDAIGTHRFRIENTSTTTEKLFRTNVFRVKKSTEYTLSFWLLTDTKAKHADVYVMTRDSLTTDETSSSYSTSHKLMSEVKTDGAWKQYVYSFSTNSTAVQAYVRFDHNGNLESGLTTNIYIAKVYMYEGPMPEKKKSDNTTVYPVWSEHPSEVYEGVTSIDSTGITVSHTDANTKTHMNSKGFFIYNSQGETVGSLATETGLSVVNANKIYADNIRRVYEGDATLYVNHDYTGESIGTSTKPFKSFADLYLHFEKCPIVNKAVTVNIVTKSEISETLKMEGLSGIGSLLINYDKACVHRTNSSSMWCITMKNMSLFVKITGNRSSYNSNDGAILCDTGGQHGIKLDNCSYVNISYININTKNWGIYTTATKLFCSKIDFGKTSCAYEVRDCSLVSDSDGCGNCTEFFKVYSGSIFQYGDNGGGYRPFGNKVEVAGKYFLVGAERTQTNSFRVTPPKPATSDQYATYSQTDYGYWSEGYGSWNSNGKKVYQGSWESYGVNRGVFILDHTAIRNWLSNGTPKDGSTITLERQSSGGYSSAQSIHLCGSTATAASGSAPAVTKSYGIIGSLEWGQKKTFNIPTAFVNDLKSGVIKSIMFYISTGGNYVLFQPSISLKLKANKPV